MLIGMRSLPVIRKVTHDIDWSTEENHEGSEEKIQERELSAVASSLKPTSPHGFRIQMSPVRLVQKNVRQHQSEKYSSGINVKV
jgi:hypothetical protein